MAFKITFLRDSNIQKYVSIENPKDNTIRVIYNVRSFCPGCIVQILVSKSNTTYQKVADINSFGGMAILEFDFPSDVNEVFVAIDLQYRLQDAINNFPKNIVAKVERIVQMQIPIIPLAVIGGIAGLVYIFRDKIRRFLRL